MRALSKVLVVIGMIVVLAGLARAEVQFDRVIVIAGDDQANTAMVALDAFEPGKLDIAWRHKDGSTRYTLWDREELAKNDGKVVDGEVVCGLTHCIYGLSRDQGVVRIGANNHKALIQWTRGEDGKWTESRTGVTAVAYYGAIGAYDANPLTGRGAFYGLNDQNQSVYVAEREDGTWDAQILRENQKPNTRGSFTFTSRGEPVVAYQILQEPAVLAAGKVGAVKVGIAPSYDWYPLDVAADTSGKIHLGVATHIGATTYYVSADGGETWTGSGIYDSATYGDAPAIRIAASPEGRMIAVVFCDFRNNALHLATSADGGQNWAIQDLPGGGGQFPDVAFDKQGALYVVYFQGGENKLKLLVADNPLEAAAP